MDLRRLRAGEWVTAVCGFVLVLAPFLPWYRSSRPAASAQLDVTAWEAYAIMDVVVFVTGLLGVGLLLLTATQRSAAAGIAADALLALVAGIVAVATLVRVLAVPDLDGTMATERTAFAWIGLLASFGVLAGALIAMRDERLSRPGKPTDVTGVPIDGRASPAP